MRFPRPTSDLLSWAHQLISRLEADFYSRPVVGEATLGAGPTTEVSEGAVRGRQSFVVIEPNDATAAGAAPFVEQDNHFRGRFLISHTGGAGGTVRYAVL